MGNGLGTQLTRYSNSEDTEIETETHIDAESAPQTAATTTEEMAIFTTHPEETSLVSGGTREIEGNVEEVGIVTG